MISNLHIFDRQLSADEVEALEGVPQFQIITDQMIQSGVDVLRESGKLYGESSSDEALVKDIVNAVLGRA